MNNQLILFDCIHGMILAFQQKKIGMISDEEFALAEESYKELALLAKHDALQSKEEGVSILKEVDFYLQQKVPSLAKKLTKGRSHHERYLFSARLSLCSSLLEVIGTLIKLIEAFSINSEKSISAALTVELEILKKIYSFFQTILEAASYKEQTKLFFELEASETAEHHKMENLLFHTLKTILKNLDIWTTQRGIPQIIQEQIRTLAIHSQHSHEDDNKFISHILLPNMALKDTLKAMEKIIRIVESPPIDEMNSESIDENVQQSSLWYQQQFSHWNNYCFDLLS